MLALARVRASAQGSGSDAKRHMKGGHTVRGYLLFAQQSMAGWARRAKRELCEAEELFRACTTRRLCA
eukprot:221134-Pleurochrysis_carterae.AAC.1